jgi:hypothetical protein
VGDESASGLQHLQGVRNVPDIVGIGKQRIQANRINDSARSCGGF